MGGSPVRRRPTAEREEPLISGDHIAVGKPDPEGYKSAAVTLGVELVDCLVVEDAPAGVEAGHRAGMRVIAVATTHHIAELKTPWVVRDLANINLECGGSDQRSGRMRVLVKDGLTM